MLSHHAAQMDVRRSVADPLFDARVNLLGLLNLLEDGAAARAAARALRLDSGGAVYGEQDALPGVARRTRPSR